MTEGKKFDADKLRIDLIPPEAIVAIAKVLGYGAEKYSDRNWEQGIKFFKLFGAIQRHLWTWFDGEDIDEESGNSHLEHALTTLAMLIASSDRDMFEFDDRVKKSSVGVLDNDEESKEAIIPLSDKEKFFICADIFHKEIEKANNLFIKAINNFITKGENKNENSTEG